MGGVRPSVRKKANGRTPVPKRKRQSRGRDKPSKDGNKCPDLTLNRAYARLAMAESDVARLEMEKAASAEPRACCGSTRSYTAADEMAEQRHQPDQSVQRVTIKFFYELLGSPPEEDWDQRDGTIAWIRRLMVPKELGSRLGGTAPWPATVLVGRDARGVQTRQALAVRRRRAAG